MGPSDGTRVEILNRQMCFDLLAQVPVGRIGVSIDALPAVLPVHFSLFDETVLLRTVPGTKLDTATIGHVVAFQADGYEPLADTGWSVLLQGLARAVSGQQARANSVPIRSWDSGSAVRLVQIQATVLSGRRLLGADGGIGTH
jgi:nitroimidazol reductase NimA-like FMN-containing flavoprotein (pyridoxamine 5'-phosphate oxidase superfamily)